MLSRVLYIPYSSENVVLEKGMTKYLCSCLGVSTSGYYNYLKNEEKRQERDEQDKNDFEITLKVHKYRNRKKGSRQIKLLLQNKYGLNFNLKKDISLETVRKLKKNRHM